MPTAVSMVEFCTLVLSKTAKSVAPGTAEPLQTNVFDQLSACAALQVRVAAKAGEGNASSRISSRRRKINLGGLE